jgi:hypothetical protein
VIANGIQLIVIREEERDVLRRITWHEGSLRDVSEELKADREVVMEAMKQKEQADREFQDAIEEIRGDRKCMIKAMVRMGVPYSMRLRI